MSNNVDIQWKHINNKRKVNLPRKRKKILVIPK